MQNSKRKENEEIDIRIKKMKYKIYFVIAERGRTGI